MSGLIVVLPVEFAYQSACASDGIGREDPSRREAAHGSDRCQMLMSYLRRDPTRWARTHAGSCLTSSPVMNPR